MSALRVIRAAARLQIVQLTANLFMVFTVLLQPFFIAVTAMYLLRHRPDFDPMFVVVGAGLSGLWSVALFDGTWAVQSERWQGTLELVAGSPASLLLVTGGRMAGSMAFSLVSMVVSYAIGAWLFGYALVVRDPLGFAIALAGGLGALWAVAILLAPIGILSRVATRSLGVLEYPVYTLSGFLFPILLLPDWSRAVSYVLIPYWAAVALHGTSTGELAAPALAGILAILAVGSAVVLILARGLLGVALTRARRDGTLALS